MDNSCSFVSFRISFPKKLLAVTVLASLLASCGGGSESGLTVTSDVNSNTSGPVATPNPDQIPPQVPGPLTSVVPVDTTVTSGIFLDSPVENLSYTTASQSGFTDEQGRFNYVAGETIVFKIGNIEFPPVVASEVITPIDLFSGGAVNHRGVVNVSRLLQTMDSDNDPSNGILLAQWADNIIAPEAIDFESLDFTEQLNNLLSTYSGSSRSLVGGSEAMGHLANSLISNGIPVSMVDESERLILLDSNTNGIPDEFDWDDDGDGVNDAQDQFPLDPSEQFDTDSDGIGNNADPDDDNDGHPDNRDAFPFSANEHLDSDNDGIGNRADTDDDNDGTTDSVDAFPLNAAEQLDADGDGIGNNADTDDDNDGFPDTQDAFPLSPLESRDTDGDGIGDNSDSDDDNDGVEDIVDAFPLNVDEFADPDRDGIGNNADTDDDGDGIPDDSDTNEGTTGNTPPNLTVPANMLVSNRVTASAVIGVSDAENNIVRISWTVVSGPVNGDMTILTNDSFTEAELKATTIGLYEIGVLATDGIDETYRTFTVEVANSAPVITDISIEQLQPTAEDFLDATHAPVTDADGDALQSTYIWLINDLPVNTGVSYLPPGVAVRGDLVAVRLEVTDGTHTVSATSPTVELLNSAPVVRSVELLPRIATVNDELVASLSNLADADGDDIELSYIWTLNDQVLSEHTESSLPAGIAVHQDVVSVQVTMSDGVVSVNSGAVSISIVNAPSEFNDEAVPQSLTFSQPVSFTAMFTDPDGTEVETTLASAPQGLSYDEATGTVDWTPTPLMLQSNETYIAYFASSDNQIAEVNLNVVDSNRGAPLARSGIEVPRRSQPLDTGDFDGDGVIEVLSHTWNQRIFTLQLDGDEITQDWLYPFALNVDEDIHSVWAHGTDGSQIVVVTENGVFLIETRDSAPVRVAESAREIVASRYADLDSDDVAELVLIDSAGNLSALSTSTWTEIWPDLTLQSSSDFGVSSYALEIANVDADSALEIITSTGDVIDGETGVLEWKHTSDFGLLITTGDVDGDGDQDIVASSRWNSVTSYDVAAQASLWVYDLSDTCALKLVNLDADTQDELIYGGCQHGQIEIYDLATGTAVLQEEIDDPEFNSGFTSLTVADIDNDGLDELVFGTGTSSSAEDNMVFASVPSTGDTTPGLVVNSNPAQLGSFHLAGWDTVTADEDRAVFVMPNTEGEQDGQRIGVLTESGDFTVSDVTDSNWSSLSAAEVVDSNSDGIAEIIVSVARIRTGRLLQLNLDDFSELAALEDVGEVVSVETGIAANGAIKAVLATDEEMLHVYDIASGVTDWTSGGLSGGNMVGAITRSTDEGFEIIAATSTELTVWQSNTTGYVKSFTAAASCDYLENYAYDGQHYIACVENSFSSTSTFSLFNTQLVKQVEVSLPFEITAMANTGGQQLLVASSASIGQSFFTSQKENRLHLFDPFISESVWTSAPLIGEINGIDVLVDEVTGAQKIAVSTDAAMYIAK